MKLTTPMVIACGFLVLAGCATVPEKSPVVSVSAFAQADASGLKKFEIVKSPRNQSQSRFEEIAAALQTRLVSAGYVQAAHADAELTIFLNYTSDDAWSLYPTSDPELAVVGGEKVNVPDNLTAGGPTSGPVVRSYNLPRVDYTGERYQYPPAVVSMVSVGIQAVPTSQYRSLAALPKAERKNHPVSAVWEIYAWHVGKGTAAERQLVPDIIKLMAPYFAKNSKGTVELPYTAVGLSE